MSSFLKINNNAVNEIYFSHTISDNDHYILYLYYYSSLYFIEILKISFLYNNVCFYVVCHFLHSLSDCYAKVIFFISEKRTSHDKIDIHFFLEDRTNFAIYSEK